MSKRRDIIEGLQILEKYDANGYIDAQHDVVYGAPPDIHVSEEDADRLIYLGFTYNKDGWKAYT